MFFNSLYNHIARYYESPDTTCDYLQAIIQPRNAIIKTSSGTTVHFYNNIIHGSSWNWDFGDGGTDTVRMPVHTYAGPGVYTVYVIVNYQNCIDTAYTTVTIIDDAGIKENEINEIRIFPNPATTELSVDLKIPGNYIFELYDLLGEKIISAKLESRNNTVGLEGVSNGVYIYEITNEKVNAIKNDKLLIINDE